MGRWERATNSSGGARSGTVTWMGHARGTAMQGFRDSVGTGTGGTRSNRLECRTGTGLGPGQESGFQQSNPELSRGGFVWLGGKRVQS